MWPDLRQRQRAPEWMDEPGVDPHDLQRSLRFIQRVNRWLGYTRATIHHLQRFSRNWRPQQRIDILDLATGSADIPLAIARWARAQRLNVRIVGIDLHPITTAIAQASARPEPHDGLAEQRHTLPIHIVRGDVLNPPFEAGSFDYAITGLFLHHLDDDQVVQVLRIMDRVTRRGIIVGDLLRNRRAYVWINLLTAFSSRMIRHDSLVSVAQTFTREEILRLRDRAGLTYPRFHRHFAHRFVLAGEKQPDSTTPGSSRV
jgi:ubiquinone/menaquinone biosynthesis C-methylase UbiE